MVKSNSKTSSLGSFTRINKLRMKILNNGEIYYNKGVNFETWTKNFKLWLY